MWTIRYSSTLLNTLFLCGQYVISMFVHKWWLVIISIVAVKASSIHGESLGLYHQNARAVPPSICSGDLSFTKGYRCEDYEVCDSIVLSCNFL